MSLRSTLDALTTTFTNGVLNAIRAASMDELLGARVSEGRPRKQLAGGGQVSIPSRGKRAKKSAGRLQRRSAAQLQKGLDKIVALLKRAAEPMRTEQIQKALELDRRELPRLVQKGLKAKVLKKRGEKRATTYSVT